MHARLRWRTAAATLASIAALAACSGTDAPQRMTMPGTPRLHADDPTNLRPTVTATARWRGSVDHEWTLEKSVSPASAALPLGSSATFHYTLTATRLAGSAVEALDVQGQVCVENTGSGDTENLQITANVQGSTNGGGLWSTLASQAVDLSSAPVVPGGETRCYGYTIPFTAVAGAIYRVEARVGITNYSGMPGQLAIFERYASFTLPAAPDGNDSDTTATLTDLLTCPAGFTCTPSSGNWSLTGTRVVEYDVVVTNVSAPCAHGATAPNAARLTEGTSGTTHDAQASVTLTTPACEPPPTGLEGCTPGYWKQSQHFGNWTGYIPTGPSASRYNTVFGVNLFSSSTTLLAALRTGGGGIYRLGRHSTAALLNSASGSVAYGMTPAQVIAAVQAAVASGNYDGASDVFERLNERSCPLARAE